MQTNLNPSFSYLLACSFGPDSMALFGLLLKEKKTFSVAHVNYQMRGQESEKETSDLKAFCEKHQIPLDVQYVDGHQLAGNFQAEARRIRYEFFKTIMAKRGHDILLTAHHRDDFLETYFMQTSSRRKTFYFGIKHETTINEMNVVRPLLSCYKEELVAYCDAYDIPYAIDRSNLEPNYTRNKIRLQKINHMPREEKERLYEEIKTKNVNLKAIEHKLLTDFSLDKVNIAKFLTLAADQRAHLLYLLFSKREIAHLYSKNKADALISLILAKRQSFFVRIQGHIYFSKYEDHFSFIDVRQYQFYQHIISSPIDYETPQFRVNLSNKDAKPHFSLSEYPLCITPAKAGDRYTVAGYQKVINRMYIDMKMPRHLRLIWPIVKNKDGRVLYVPRYRKDYTSQANDLFFIKLIL